MNAPTETPEKTIDPATIKNEIRHKTIGMLVYYLIMIKTWILVSAIAGLTTGIVTLLFGLISPSISLPYIIFSLLLIKLYSEIDKCNASEDQEHVKQVFCFAMILLIVFSTWKIIVNICNIIS